VRRHATALACVVLTASCNLDTDTAAPHVAPPTAAGACGTTETLLPKLLAFVREDRFAPLRRIIEMRLLPSAENPTPDPSLRTLLGGIVSLISQLGLDRTALVLDLVAKGEVEEKLAPFLVTLLEFIDGRYDGVDHYEVADAGALFLRRCDPDFLLLAVEELLRFESPSHPGEPWMVALLGEIGELLKDPGLEPFLEGFERESQRGKPAVTSLLVQIMIFLSDQNFAIERVETLLESAVYPVVSADLRARIERMVYLLDEATRPQAGILEPLQGAVRCGLMHAEARDQLIGFGYDLIASREVGLDAVLMTTQDVVSIASAKNQLGLLADLVKIIREDLRIRDDLRELIAVLLSRPDVELSIPVLIDLLDSGVLSELLEAFVKLLGGCGRS
jgi:hypothetical protein